MQKREVADHQVLPDQESLLQRARNPYLPFDLLHQELLSAGDLTELHLCLEDQLNVQESQPRLQFHGAWQLSALHMTFLRQQQLIHGQLIEPKASKLHQSVVQVHALALIQEPMAYGALQFCHLDYLEELNRMQEFFLNQFVLGPKCHGRQVRQEVLQSELGKDARFLVCSEH